MKYFLILVALAVLHAPLKAVTLSGSIQTGYTDARTVVQVSKEIKDKFELGGISLRKDGFGEGLSCHYVRIKARVMHDGWQLKFTNINYQRLNTLTDFTPLRADFVVEASYEVKGWRVGYAHRCNHEVNNYPEIDRSAAFGGYNRIFLEWNFEWDLSN